MGFKRPADEDLGQACLRLLCDDTSWMCRRKELCVVTADRTVRRHLSFDFEVPSSEPQLAQTADGKTVDWLPLCLLPKAPTRMTRFDLCDESGSSLALPTRAENAQVSSAAIQQLAFRVLQKAADRVNPTTILSDLEQIAGADADTAFELKAEGFPALPDDVDATTDRQKLMKNEQFRWMLDLVAEYSIVMLPVVDYRDSRHIIKLGYDDEITYQQSRFDSFLERLGWRGYLLILEHPFVGSSSFHFELDAPENMQITDAGLVVAGIPMQTATKRVRKRVHFYVPDATMSRRGLSFAQLRVRGRGFASGAVLAATVVAVLLTGGWIEADQLATGANAAAAVLLVFPGLIAAYVAQNEHPLVTRLLSFARRVLLVVSGVALAAAARLAILTGNHQVQPHTLRIEFLVAAILAWVGVLALALTRQLPLRLTSRLRRKTRLRA